MASIEALIIGYAAIFEAVAIGVERADVEGRSFSYVANTALGKIPLAQMTRVVICISIASTAQMVLWNNGVKDPVTLVMPYSLAYLVSSAPYTLYVYRLAIRGVRFIIPWRDIAVFIIASTTSSYIAVLWGSGDIVIKSFWRDLMTLLPSIGISVSIYALISLILSNRLRILFITGTKYVLKTIL
jgi:hypothetical protein